MNNQLQLYLEADDYYLGYLDSDNSFHRIKTDAFVNPETIRIADGYLEFRDEQGNWHSLLDKDNNPAYLKGPSGPVGPSGPKGDKGDTGQPAIFRGTISNPQEMDEKISDGAQIGDLYIIDGIVDNPDESVFEHNGAIYVVLENQQWKYCGNIRGPKGENGQDGADGKNGQDGQNGADGKDGQTPYIGPNGNWFIGDEDTGVIAEGTKIQFLTDSQINQYIKLYGPETLTPNEFASFLKTFSDRFTTDPSNSELSSVSNNIGTWSYNCKLQYPNSFILDKDLFTIELNETSLVSIQYKQVIPSFEVRSGSLISSLNGVEDNLGNIQGPQGATGETGQDGHTPYLSVGEYKPGILALMSDGEFITNELGEVFPVYCNTLAYPEHVSESSWFGESKPNNTLVKWCGEDTFTLDTGETFDPGHVYRHVKAGNVVKALTLYGKGLYTEYQSEWVEFPIDDINLLKMKWELLSIPYTYDPAKLIFSPMGSYVEVTMEDGTIDIQNNAPLFNEVFSENQDVNSFIDQNRTSGWMVGYKEFICQNDMWVLEEYNNEVPESYKTLNLAVRMSKDSNESLENSTEL